TLNYYPIADTMSTDITSGHKDNNNSRHRNLLATGGGGGRLLSSASGAVDNQLMAKPVYLQRLEHALRLDGLIAQVHRSLNEKNLDEELNTNISKQQSKAVKTRVYNLSKVKKNKKWLKNIL
ncbi:unnamed protein product, partial [Medioppia subpectinata]